MTKVVRAFSLDQRVSETLDEMTFVPGRLKPMNKSRYVNDALDWYMTKNIAEWKRETEERMQWYQNKLEEKRLTIGGLEDDLAGFRKARFPDFGNNGGRARFDEGLNPEITASLNCRCLWCRLKRLLLRSKVEQQEQ